MRAYPANRRHRRHISRDVLAGSKAVIREVHDAPPQGDTRGIWISRDDAVGAVSVKPRPEVEASFAF